MNSAASPSIAPLLLQEAAATARARRTSAAIGLYLDGFMAALYVHRN
ncbi:hypothetical protein [Actinomadura sp. 6N118]